MSVRSSSHAVFLPGFLALHTAKALPLLLRYPVGELSVKCISQEAFIGRLARQTHNRRRIKQIAPPRYASSVVSPQERFSSPGEGGGGRREEGSCLKFIFLILFFFSFLSFFSAPEYTECSWHRDAYCSAYCILPPPAHKPVFPSAPLAGILLGLMLRLGI